MASEATDIISKLFLSPHPEGGHYRQVWAAPAGPDGRALATCIYFLLARGERSHWHRVDADELWLWHAGDPLTLLRADTAQGPANMAILGPDVLGDQTPQLRVARDQWQSAETPQDGRAGWSLVSCVVAPGFTFDGFSLAPADFDIRRA